MAPKKYLIVVAHRGEALEWLQESAPFPPDSHLPSALRGDYLQGPQWDLLVTGEGFHQALERVSAVLGMAHANPYSGVINLGVAASLSARWKVGDLAQVRTAYSERGEREMEFKSFTLARTESGLAWVDVVSANQRVLGAEQAAHLGHFAPVLDRELWAIARAAALHGCPCWSFKAISDRPSLDGPIACELVREQAGALMAPLSSHVRELFFGPKARSAQAAFDSSASLPSPHVFHFTQSMQQRWRKLAKGIEASALEALLGEIAAMAILPKERGLLLLERMKDLIAPEGARLAARLAEVEAPLRALGAEFTYTPEYEDDLIHLKATLDGVEGWHAFFEGAKEFQVERLVELLQGRGSDV